MVESVDLGSLSKLRLVMKQLSRVRQGYKFIKAHRRQARAKLHMQACISPHKPCQTIRQLGHLPIGHPLRPRVKPRRAQSQESARPDSNCRRHERWRTSIIFLLEMWSRDEGTNPSPPGRSPREGIWPTERPQGISCLGAGTSRDETPGY